MLRNFALLNLLALSLGATPTYLDTGSASITCVPNGPGDPTTVQSSGPQAAAQCQLPNLSPGGAGVDANGLNLLGSIGGWASAASFSASGQSVDTVTEGDSSGVAQFNISFQWGVLLDFGIQADVAADFYINGVPVWNDNHFVTGDVSVGNFDIAAVDEPFSLGQQFTLQEDVSISGSGGGPTGIEEYGNYISVVGILEISDPILIPEPRTAFMVIVGILLLGIAGRDYL